jgi:hypothetical protein
MSFRYQKVHRYVPTYQSYSGATICKTTESIEDVPYFKCHFLAHQFVTKIEGGHMSPVLREAVFHQYRWRQYFTSVEGGSFSPE